MPTTRDLIALLQEKYTDKDTFFATPEEYAFFAQSSPQEPKISEEILLTEKKWTRNDEPSKKEEKIQKPAVSLKENAPEPVLELKPLKPLSKASYIDNLRSVVQKAAPHMTLKESIPDDSKAKKVGSLWQEHLQDVHVALLSFGAQGRELAFLQNVAAAVSSLLAPAQIIDGFKMEGEQKWELFFTKTPLKLLLTPPLATWKGKALAQYFRENPAAQTATLGPAPVLLLKPLREYLQNPQLKRDLWKALVSHLSP